MFLDTKRLAKVQETQNGLQPLPLEPFWTWRPKSPSFAENENQNCSAYQ